MNFSESTPSHNHIEFKGIIGDKRHSHMTAYNVCRIYIKNIQLKSGGDGGSK
jgi:hypothetical protein